MEGNVYSYIRHTTGQRFRNSDLTRLGVSLTACIKGMEEYNGPFY